MAKELKRVVVTGIGLVTPLGNDVASSWNNVLNGVSGANKITLFDATNFRTQFACEVKNFDVDDILDKKEAHKLDRCSLFMLSCANQAINDSKLKLEEENKDRIGVITATGMGGIISWEEEFIPFVQNDFHPRFSPFYIIRTIPNTSTAYVSIHWGLRGPSYTTVSACASSAHAIIDAFTQIQLGRADVMVTGGCDADITYASVGGFNALRALSHRNEEYQTASRPFSLSRDGFVLGEGGGALILEEYEHAVKRGATIYAELAGIGMNSDAYHLVAPDPTGKGALQVMDLALKDANTDVSEVDYINAHGTSTPLGDIAETLAITELFGKNAYNLNISSTKSMTGHALGGAGSMEAVLTILAMKNNVIPPTINHAENDKDPKIDYNLNFTFNVKQDREVRCAISNSFGFGGHNACLVFKKVK